MSIYDLSEPNDNDKLVCSSERAHSHEQPVSALSWWRPAQTVGSSAHMLVSTAYDGRLIVWQMGAREMKLSVHKIFMITVGSLPRSLAGKALTSERPVSGDI